jgi:hydrogenase maturation protein HypF
MGLTGWVGNTTQGVCLEVEGAGAHLAGFLLRLEQDKPPRAFIQSLESSWLDPAGYEEFKIRASEAGEKTAVVSPDIATCAECRQEIFDPHNRRYRYPFTNCTHCGPRFSIIEALPYDRGNTTMKLFKMCPACVIEYEDPGDRRFHAQPNACPQCGPHLELWDAAGKKLASHDEAILSSAAAIRAGRIVALKGLGGFQMLVDARSEEAVRRLRQRKEREEKPFALMFPSFGWIKRHCEVSQLEERLLASPEAPIVLLKRTQTPTNAKEMAEAAEAAGIEYRNHSVIDDSQTPIADSVAPGNPYLGVMLPYTPLHHLLMAELGIPVVATSGNRSDEPICTDEQEALQRLGGLADLFLVHDRPIARQVDDSVARVMLGRELVLRRARGYAPLPIHVKTPLASALALGAQLKNTIAVSAGTEVFVSQHIGDLETAQAIEAFRKVIGDFQRLYDLQPVVVVCDAHPDYYSSQLARENAVVGCGRQIRVVSVQHHYAHVLACMAENELEPPVLGIAWDGTGYGLDGTIWGGEFLEVTGDVFQRVGSFRPFRLPGGEKAIREPRRSALGLLYEMMGQSVFTMRELWPSRDFTKPELAVLQKMLERQLNSPVTTSVGRLFDAVAGIIGLRQVTRYEGQAAMELEYALEGSKTGEGYPVRIAERQGESEEPAQRVVGLGTGKRAPAIVIDWGPMVEGILEDMRYRMPKGKISARFHNTLVEAMVRVARWVGEERVVLSGGCFQNKYLTERAVRRLTQEGFRVYWHQRIPPNDGGIAAGQVFSLQRHSEVFGGGG